MILVLLGCAVEQALVVAPDPPRPPAEPSAEPSVPNADTAAPPPDTEAPPEDTGPVAPRAPEAGELVLAELMIDPAAVADAHGEWIEIVSVASDPLDWTGLELADDGVDLTVALGSGVVAPGGRFVVCADGDAAANGGVSCDGTWLYHAFGGGLALANTGDELEIRLGGAVLDRVTWSAGFAEVGAATGLEPSAENAADNDEATRWCAAVAALPGGDSGTPGEPNRPCP